MAAINVPIDEESDWSGDEDSLPDLDEPMPVLDLMKDSEDEDHMELVDESEDEVNRKLTLELRPSEATFVSYKKFLIDNFFPY